MPDMITPVAAQIQPPDPNKGFNLLANIIGIQQARQNLATGAIQQQTALAESQQAQQRNAELQRAQAAVIQGAQSGAYDDGKGGIDRQKAANDVLRNAPTYGQGIVSSLLSQANEVVSNRQALQNLNDSQRKALGDAFGALATKPDLTATDVIDEADRQIENNSDPGFRRMVLSSLTHLPATGTTDQLRKVMRGWSIAAASPQSAQSAPAVSPYTAPSGAIGFMQTNPQSPGGIGTTGPQVAQGLTPTQQPGYVRQIAGITGETGTDNERFNRITGAAAQSQSGIALADQVAALADQVRTGKLSKEWADRLAVLKQDNPQITARQMLGKYAAQLQTLAEGNAATDAERSQIQSGMPDPNTMDPGAVRQAAEYLHGYFRMAQDRGVNAMQHVTKNGTPGLTMADTQFTSQRDPFVYAFKDMPRAEQKRFLLERFGPGKSKELDEFERRVTSQ